MTGLDLELNSTQGSSNSGSSMKPPDRVAMATPTAAAGPGPSSEAHLRRHRFHASPPQVRSEHDVSSADPMTSRGNRAVKSPPLSPKRSTPQVFAQPTPDRHRLAMFHPGEIPPRSGHLERSGRRSGGSLNIWDRDTDRDVNMSTSAEERERQREGERYRRASSHPSRSTISTRESGSESVAMSRGYSSGSGSGSGYASVSVSGSGSDQSTRQYDYSDLDYTDSSQPGSIATTQPTTAPSSPSVPMTQQRVWRPTPNVPEHIARRHRATRTTGRGLDEVGEVENRWLSEDEGMGESSRSGAARAIGRRRRRGSGGGGGGGGNGGGGAHSAGLHASTGTGIGVEHTDDRIKDRPTSARPKPFVFHGAGDLTIPKHSSLRPRSHQHQHQHQHKSSNTTTAPSRHHHRPPMPRRRSSPPEISTVPWSSLGTGTVTPASAVSSSDSIGAASPDRLGQMPPTVADLVPPPNPIGGARVLRTQRALIDPQPQPSPHQTEFGAEGEQVSPMPASASGFDDTDHIAMSRQGSTSTSSGSRGGKEGGRVSPVDRNEEERIRVWREGLLGQLRKLLTCTLCPPGSSQLLHHPITLPCGHTLSSEHLSLPVPPPLPPNFAILPPHDQHALQQIQSNQRLSLWSGIMCPIPSCKRYSPYAIPGGTTHEPASPVTAFLAPPNASTASGSTAPTGVPLASGVMYYPPPPAATSTFGHPPPAYSSDPPSNETGSPLLDTTVDKVQHVVMRELGLGMYRVAPIHAARAMMVESQQQQHHQQRQQHQAGDTDSDDDQIGVGAVKPGLKTSLTLDLDLATLDDHHMHSHPHSHAQAHAPAQGPSTLVAGHPHAQSHLIGGIDRKDSAISSGSATSGSTASLELERKISKRRRNTLAEPGRPELSFERELMGILECDVCAMLLYEPITTPCQHSFCGKCLGRSLDHSNRCPVCRQDLPSYAYFQDHAVNKVLLTIIKTAFPTEYTERQQSIEKDERDARLDTPLFICTLAFPGMPTILHVFEPRYRLMIRRAIESSSPRFGMLLPSRGGVEGNIAGVSEFGTMLEIQSVQMLPDGRSMVETTGTRRFRLLEKGGLDGYTVGRIEFIDDISPEEEAALELEAVREAARKYQLAQAGHTSLHASQSGSDPHQTSTTSGTGTAPPNQATCASQPIPLPTDPALASSSHIHTQLSSHTPRAIPSSPTPTSTADLMAVCHSFIDQLRSGSAPWLLQRLNSTYGTMPTDPGEFSFWMALVMPIDEYEKARLLPIRSPRLRLKLIVHWVESLRGSWWFSSG